MKNLKNTMMAAGLMAVLGFGAVSANAGLLISDKSGAQPCGTVKDSVLNQIAGVIIVGFPMLDGILIAGRDGIMVSDRDGIMVSDKGCGSKTGIMVSDRTGILVSD